ncbi:MAG: phosphoribosylformylglycinamidine synthase subunit PurS [Deltaproteobacteria bacterium]|nr:phosphoribosylformylglycinamidine synthase subunit PurS [Deltaproteobacteria bacterium]MBI4373435.1 phosphoribosylformylglycinamidine synthase subunit PurS [Deltaproteobacteria bacterium]
MKAKIYITLKPGVLDPQGKAVQQALASLGFNEVKDVRIGKYIELELEKNSQERIRQMCEKLLANTVIESYRFEIE